MGNFGKKIAIFLIFITYGFCIKADNTLKAGETFYIQNKTTGKYFKANMQSNRYQLQSTDNKDEATKFIIPGSGKITYNKGVTLALAEDPNKGILHGGGWAADTAKLTDEGNSVKKTWKFWKWQESNDNMGKSGEVQYNDPVIIRSMDLPWGWAPYKDGESSLSLLMENNKGTMWGYDSKSDQVKIFVLVPTQETLDAKTPNTKSGQEAEEEEESLLDSEVVKADQIFYIKNQATGLYFKANLKENRYNIGSTDNEEEATKFTIPGSGTIKYDQWVQIVVAEDQNKGILHGRHSWLADTAKLKDEGNEAKKTWKFWKWQGSNDDLGQSGDVKYGDSVIIRSMDLPFGWGTYKNTGESSLSLCINKGEKVVKMWGYDSKTEQEKVFVLVPTKETVDKSLEKQIVAPAPSGKPLKPQTPKISDQPSTRTTDSITKSQATEINNIKKQIYSLQNEMKKLQDKITAIQKQISKTQIVQQPIPRHAQVAGFSGTIED